VESLILTQTLRLSGYAPDLATQPGCVVVGLRLLITAVQIVAVAIAFLAICGYPLHGDTLAGVKACVARLHEEKAARRLPYLLRPWRSRPTMCALAGWRQPTRRRARSM
jgi:Na+/melibiose symporter-like transporter